MQLFNCVITQSTSFWCAFFIFTRGEAAQQYRKNFHTRKFFLYCWTASPLVKMKKVLQELWHASFTIDRHFYDSLSNTWLDLCPWRHKELLSNHLCLNGFGKRSGFSLRMIEIKLNKVSLFFICGSKLPSTWAWVGLALLIWWIRLKRTYRYFKVLTSILVLVNTSLSTWVQVQVLCRNEERI